MTFMRVGTKEEQARALLLERRELVINTVGLLQAAYTNFRKIAKLKPIKNTGEACMGLADKTGRICRQLKHVMRKDPKPGAFTEVCDAMAGVFVYILLLAEKHKVDLSMGMADELAKAMIQHKETKHGSKSRCDQRRS